MLSAYLKSLPTKQNVTAKKLFRTRITNKYAEAFQNIARWTRRRASQKEVWWNSVWLYIRDDVEEMLRIHDRILEDVPVTDEQSRLINEYMDYGRPRGILFENEDGSCSYEICLDVQNCQFLPYRANVNVGCGLLTQPAFALGQQYFRRWSQPRFIAKCRAPSCGKQFFTGRKDATACPGSQAGKKNKCSLEWNRYKRYLNKIKTKDIEESWNDNKLKEQFLSR